MKRLPEPLAGMVRAARNVLVALLARHFKRTPLPESFRELVAHPERVIVVSRVDSIVGDALLRSFAMRSGLQGAVRVLPHEAAVRRPRMIHWVGVTDEQAIAALIQQSPNQSFRTLNIFCGRGPVKNYPSSGLGVLQNLALIIGRRFLITMLGAPIVLNEALPISAKRLVRDCKVDLYRSLKLVRGTPFQPITVQAQSVLSGTEYERELKILADSSNMPLWRARKRATRAFYEMAANPHKPLYFPLGTICRLLITRLFTVVRTRGLEEFVTTARGQTVVLVPNHRSHFDYILLGTELYQSNLNPPLVAAGVNLSFWPVGFFLRSVGAYFVKRDARSDRFHGVVLKRYVTYLLKRGHLQEFFIEGGRSRTGKMRQPKLGLVRLFVEAYLKGIRKDVIFVPVSISYENVVEDTTFGDENSGKAKAKENLVSLARAWSLFQKKYGEVAINFGRGISLAEFVNSAGGINRPADMRPIVTKLGSVLTQRIRGEMPLTLSSLAYTALMLTPRYALSREELSRTIRQLAACVQAYRKRGFDVGEASNTLRHFLEGRETLLSDLNRGGVIRINRCLGGDIFVIPGTKRFTADFYRNSAVHALFYQGLASLLLVCGRTLKTEDALGWWEIFEHDFVLPDRQTAAEEWQRSVAVFCDLGLIGPQSDATYVQRSTVPGLFIPGLLLSAIESHVWVYRNLHARMLEGETTSIPYQQFMRSLQAEFRTAMYAGVLDRTESASQSNLQSALESLISRQIISIDEPRGQPKMIQVLKPIADETEMLSAAAARCTAWLASTQRRGE